MIITLPLFTDVDNWEFEALLDEAIYIIRGRKIAPYNVEPYYVIDLLTADGEEIETGMRLVENTRFAFRSRDGWGLLGYLVYNAQENVLVYDDEPV